MPSVAKRVVKVGTVSSAARIPFPSATSFSATPSRSWVIVETLLERPLPIGDFERVDAELVRVTPACDLLVEQGLASARPSGAETHHAVDRVDGEAETVGLVPDRQFQWGINVAMLLVAAHVNVVLGRPAVSEAVDQPRIAMEVEDYRLVRGEKSFELAVRQTVLMLGVRHQFGQVNHIHEPDFDVGQVLTEQGGGRQ